MSEPIIKIEHVSKEYRLGTIGGGTLKGDLQSLMARMRGKEDPNSLLGSAPVSGSHDRFLALDDVSFDVYPGEAVGVIGRNGAGKSTLLKLLSRVTAPSKGRISFDGRIASMLEVGTGFHPELTGRENVYMNGAILGMTKAEIDRKFDEIVEFAEMEKFIDTPVKRYSSGMYVKLAFSVAAHLDSEIMIMDEVLAVGDAKFQKKCLGKMGDESTQAGRTILYVSHNMNTVRQLCTRCVVLDHGKVIFDGDTEKAIAIYSSENFTSSMQRQFAVPDLSSGNIKAAITGMKVLEDDTSILSSNNLRFQVFWKSFCPISTLQFRAILYRAAAPVGMTISKAIQVQKAGMYATTLTFDTHTLSAGDYHLDLYLGNYDPLAIETYCSQVSFLNFSVIKNPNQNGLNWLAEHWGSIAFPPIIMESTVEDSC